LVHVEIVILAERKTMFGELKPLLDAARKFVADTINDQIEDAEMKISTLQRKIKRLKAQRTLSDQFLKEIAKPPKPFRPIFTKKQLAAMKKAQAGAGIPMPPAKSAVG
jgi:hypothetical protein